VFWFFLVAVAVRTHAATWYVAKGVNGGDGSQGSPFSTVQAGVDAAGDGDSVFVAKGAYDENVSIENKTVFLYGGYETNGWTRDIDANVTVIDGGARDTVLFLDNTDSTVSGFSIRNGRNTDFYRAAGVSCSDRRPVIEYCTITGNEGEWYGGGVRNGTLRNCVIATNSAIGGAGAYDSLSEDCVFQGNTAEGSGGGQRFGYLRRCRVVENSAYWGGGVGGADGMEGCLITRNTAGDEGGGIYDAGGVVAHCTITLNTANKGGGATSSTLRNCIVYHNSANSSPNTDGCDVHFTCTVPAHPGDGNITNEPELADGVHLTGMSPCVGAGNWADSVGKGTDIDGQDWGDPPCMGCDEFVSGTATGGLSVVLQANYDAVSVAFPVAFSATIDGTATSNTWSLGIQNRLSATYSWQTAGTYPVTLTAFNDSYPAGVSATVIVDVVQQPFHYVDAGGASPASPYTSWATAARTIQDAVGAATVPGSMVRVADGTYDVGAHVAPNDTHSNRVVVAAPITVQSANGPAGAVIVGAGSATGVAVRCVYMEHESARLSGFTLTKGYSSSSGGGAYIEEGRLDNCRMKGNRAKYTGGGVYGGLVERCVLMGNIAKWGGGAADATVRSSVLSGNRAEDRGGGAYRGTLNNCTVTLNDAGKGGGVADVTLKNSIVYYNTAGIAPNHSGSTIQYSCTTPDAPGTGNIGGPPELASETHLSAGSPCVGTGLETAAYGTDIDGENWQTPPCMGCDQYSPNATGALSVAIDAPYANVTASFAVPFIARIDGVATHSSWSFGVSNSPCAEASWTTPGLQEVVLTAYNQTHPGGVSATVAVQVVSETVHYVDAGNGTPVSPYTSWSSAANTIQEAVDAASVAGAIVLVTNGTYRAGGRPMDGSTVTNVVVLTKPLTVRGVHGAGSTRVAGPGASSNSSVRCLYMDHSRAGVDGVSLRNGNALTEKGGGAYIRQGVMTNCEMRDNRAEKGGGGVRGGTVNDCTIAGNRVTGEWDNGGGSHGSVLSRCIVSNNFARGGGGASEGALHDTLVIENTADYGAGAASADLSHCTVVSNTATSDGGGTHYCTVRNSLIAANSAADSCGGANAGEFYNCTIAGNSAGNEVGGIDGGTLHNCIVSLNSAPVSPDSHDTTAYHSCAPELTQDADGNITNAPGFASPLGGDYSLQGGSPCINAGDNARVTNDRDLLGNDRIVDTVVDMGCYENPVGIDMDRDRMNDGWELRYAPSLTNMTAVTDSDGDGLLDVDEFGHDAHPLDPDTDGDRFGDWGEVVAGTGISDPSSYLCVTGSAADADGMVLQWPSVAGRLYSVRLLPHPLDEGTTLDSGIPATPPLNTYTDTVTRSAAFYRVGASQEE